MNALKLSFEQRQQLRSMHVTAAPNDPGRERAQRFAALEQTIRRWWPSQWEAMEACCAAVSTLYLEHVRQGVALVLMGESGAGKGTILERFQGAVHTEWRDDFSQASLLSANGNSKKSELEERALFKRAKHKAVLIGDLNPLFKAGSTDVLSKFYASVAVWLDGQGIVKDTGTHGLMGEKGDFTFVLLAAATTFQPRIWQSMAELGPRLLFYPVDGEGGEEVSDEDYDLAFEECKKATHDFLTWLASKYTRRQAPWPKKSESIAEALKTNCKIIAAAQTRGASLDGTVEAVRPEIAHLKQRMATLAAARAWLYGRAELDESDVAFTRRMASASGPRTRCEILLAMAEGACEVNTIAVRVGIKPDTVTKQLDALQRIGVVENCGSLATGQVGRQPNAWKLLLDAKETDDAS